MYLQLIGLTWVLNKVYQLVQAWLNSRKANIDVQSKYGKGCWAVITGATDGIGKGYCEVLAKQGVNVCLVARNEEKAQKVIEELKSLGSSSQFLFVQANFSDSVKNPQLYDEIYDKIKSLDIGLLVNNVGTMMIGEFNDISEKDLLDQIIVNCYPIVLMTKKLIPQLKNRSNRSAIINLSSVSAVHPLAIYQVYSATKAFDNYFSQGLSISLQDNIDVLSLMPGYVYSQMTAFRKDVGSISPKECVEGSLKKLGKVHYSGGHIFHALQVEILSLIPNGVVRYLKRPFIKKIGLEMQEQRNKL